MPGGIGNHAFLLAKELAVLNYRVTVLTEQREESPGEWKKFVRSNEDLTIIGVKRQFIRFITYFQRILNTYKLTRQRRWHAVIYSGKFSVWLNGIMPRTKSIVVIHGSEIRQVGLSRILFSLGLKNASHVVCVSDFTRKQLTVQYANLKIETISTINNGIRNDWIAEKIEPTCLKVDDPRLITVGGIHQRKGQFNVVQALPRFLEVFPNIKYHIVGLPVEKTRLLELISKYQLDRHVVFHHGLTDREVHDLLMRSHIFMILSNHLENGDFEGFGIAAVEAMALGLPAIGTRNSGVADAIQDGFSGKLVDADNEEEVVNALRTILDDYARYSANAKEAAENARWKHKVKDYQHLIDQL